MDSPRIVDGVGDPTAASGAVTGGPTMHDPARPAPRALGVLVVAIIVILTVTLAVAGAFSGGGTPAAVSPPPISPAIEAKWGVRVTQIGVSADGGLVDVRFVVLDPDRALAMLGDDKETNIPVLVAEDTGAVVHSAAMMPPKHTLVAGRMMYLLYRNTNGAIRRGAPVEFDFGDLHLEHVRAD